MNLRTNQIYDLWKAFDLHKLGVPVQAKGSVPVNQSSKSCNDQAGQNLLVNINDTIQQTTRFPSSFPQTMMEGAPSGEDDVNFPWNRLELEKLLSLPSSPLEEVPVNQSSTGKNMLVDNNDSTQQTTQFPPHNHQVSGDHDLLNSNCYDSTQPQQGHVNMTPNTTTSQHGGFNQPGPSLPAPRSQMENLQVHVLQNQTARPNTSNPGPDSSLQSQNRGLNTQQVQRAGSRDPFWNYVEEKDDESMICVFCQRRWAINTSISRIKWHLSGEEGRGVAICRGVNKEVQEEALKAMHSGNKRHKSTTSSINVNDRGISTCPQEPNIENENMGGDTGRVLREVQVVEVGVGEERISSYAVAGNDVVSMTGMRAQEDRVSEGALERRLMTEPVDRALEQSNLAGKAGRTQVGVQGTEQGAGEERIQLHSQAENAMENTGEGSFGHDAFQTIPGTEQVQHLERHSSCERPSINQADEPRGDSSEPSDPLCLGHGRYYDQPFAPSVSNDVIMNDVQNMVRARTEPVEEHDVENSGRLVQPGAGGRSSRILKDNSSETRGIPLPTSSKKLVGRTFEENTNMIWSLLMDDEVPSIGIYGMGGVGKTTLLQHIHNELLKRPDICDHVWWVTVSQNFSINRLQNLIAKHICDHVWWVTVSQNFSINSLQNIIAKRVDKHLYLDLSSEDDDLHRVAKLLGELEKKQKWILILDDLWDNFELHEVGIPVPLKGCKLITTTRSKRVCQQISCQHKIEVKPLSEGEAWTLFMERLGHEITLSPVVEGIAKAVARECAGLPLGIITVAGSLRGVDNLNEWRNTLKELRESGYRDMDEKVFKVLRVSYDRLDDGLPLQKCLLYCALFPEDYWIEREVLIDFLIDEGIIEEMRRQDAVDKGHTTLNRLEYVCLLEGSRIGFKIVKMHDLIRDMAIKVQQENSQFLNKAGAKLEELPDAKEWAENLTIVSLMQNRFKEIPPSHSPMCPNLSTLLLCQNQDLRFIADSFFKQLHGLKVLDLSRTGIENLPDSVSDLVTLTTLLLKNCHRLRNVPSLKKLMALKRLDLCLTRLQKMPQGMEFLTNLRSFRVEYYQNSLTCKSLY
ncbi:disease resistance protein [Salix suchowensis]|nr:disease resistance protein [Salix suchowensis]